MNIFDFIFNREDNWKKILNTSEIDELQKFMIGKTITDIRYAKQGIHDQIPFDKKIFIDIDYQEAIFIQSNNPHYVVRFLYDDVSNGNLVHTDNVEFNYSWFADQLTIDNFDISLNLVRDLSRGSNGPRSKTCDDGSIKNIFIRGTLDQYIDETIRDIYFQIGEPDIRFLGRFIGSTPTFESLNYNLFIKKNLYSNPEIK